ncbi:ankyrin repeat domain-containing protein [Legionella saoudiensis]|uniref:ankyrin repeat domain-containing protein n=1 Tax=Legionella saoudiensis TaxID=1750561 RepID=UPI000730BCBF|nr:ankyrin repeat domain-containing protein [Legionella saoudiensis]
MQEKRIREVMGNVEKYLVHSGIEHHFKEHGIFSHIDLEAEIKKVVMQEAEQLNSSEPPMHQEINVSMCLDALCAEDYETIVEEAFLDLFKLINFIGVSQGRIINNVRKYQQLIGTPKEDLLGSEGQCGGIALAFIAGEISKGISHSPSQLQGFELFLGRIAHWDGTSAINESLQHDMEFFIKKVGELQKEQFNPFPLFNEMLGSNSVLSNLSLSWIHNQYTLDFIFKEVYKTQPQLIYTSADYHASMIQPTAENEIIYFNPNQQFGSMRLKVDDKFYDLFCGGLRTGHSNTYVERMPLSLECFSSHPQEMDLETILDTLINISIEHDPATRLRSNSLKEAAKVIVNRQASNGRTALMEAAIRGNLIEVRLLLNKYGADPRLIDIKHNDALRYAITCGREDIALEILNHKDMTRVNKAADGMTYLHLALLHKQLGVVNKLLSTEDIQLNTKSQDARFSGFTPLHFAILKGLDDVCERLINNEDVLLNTPEKRVGVTPLHLAIDQHNPKVVALLLKQKRVQIDKCSIEVDEAHPQGFNAFVYLAKEFSYLDSEAEDYPETCVALADIYEQLIKANASQDGLTSEDRLFLYQHLIECDESHISSLLHDMRRGLIKLEDNEQCINLVEYLISHDDVTLESSDANLMEFYLTYSADIDSEAVVRHLDSAPQLISQLSEASRQKLNLTAATKQAEPNESAFEQSKARPLAEESPRCSELVKQSFFKEGPKKTSVYSNVSFLMLLGLAGVSTIISQYPAILNAFWGQSNLGGDNHHGYHNITGP